MRSKKKKLLKRILAAMLSVTLMSGAAVMTPIADIVGTSIVANATENIVAQGDYWRITDDDKDGKYKLTFFGTIPNYEAILAESYEIYNASASAASTAELIQASWCFATDYVTEVTVEEGTKTSADASSLFAGFYNVTSMDLSNLDTSNAITMAGMFYDCTELTSLNLSGWDTSKVTDMYGMFYDCKNLKTIIVGNGWNTDKVTNSIQMFENCTSFVGGKGTTFDNTKTDKTYARIDSSSAPGYFTKSPIIAQGSYWKVTDEDADGNYKLTIFGTIPNTNGNSSKLPWYSYRDKITEVTTENGAKTSADASYLFSYLENATSMDLSHLDTSAATGMGRMFYRCKKLTSLNLSGWDTSNVTNMNNMFYSCEKLDSLDVSGFDTSNVTNMNNMFSFCTSLTSLDLSGNWNTSKVTGMGSMFYHCENLTSLNLSGFNTSSVTTMSFMFASCLKLTSLDLSGFDTSNVIYMNDMFKSSDNFTELDLSSFNTAKVEQIQDMFQSCSNLKTITVGNGWNTGSVHFSADMFKDCTALVGGQGTAYKADVVDVTYAKVDGGTSAPGYLTQSPIIAQGSYWKLTDEDFDGNYKLTFFGTIPTHEAIKAEAEAISDASAGAASPAELIQASWVFAKNYVTEVTTEEGAKTSADASSLFENFSKVTSMDLSNLDTSNATNMDSMFYHCSSLTSLNLSGWDTSNVENMGQMFSYCSNLKTIIVGNGWNTDSVAYSVNMFDGCTSLVGGNGTTYNANTIDKTYARIDKDGQPGYLTGNPIIAQGDYWRITDEDFDDNYTLTIFGTIPDTNGKTSNIPWYDYRYNITEVTTEDGAKTSADASYLFSYLENATSMDLSHLDTSAATGMGRMFYNCKNLTSLNLSGWDTSKVTNMHTTFSYCSNLTSLDLSGWDTSNVTNMYGMFVSCSKLTTIIVGKGWNTNKVSVSNSNYMFAGCTSLVGGKGTKFADAQVTDKSYAHIDGGESNPGYLTASGYTVTWLNEDGTTSLGTSTVEEGKSPVCPDNIAPVKSDTADGKYRYSLYWTNGNNSYDFDELPKATSNVSYTAQFKKVPIWEQGKTFAIGDTLDLTDARIYYYNYDGFKDTYNRGYVGNKAYELQFGNYYNSSWYEFLLPGQYGSVSIDVKSENYGKPAALRIAGGKGTAQDPYTFSAAPYYTVTWQNYDGTVLETDDQLLAGYTVAYNGETPTKETTAQYTYTFSGWNDGKNTYGLNDTLPTVTGDITYTAQFDAVRKPYFADHKLFLDGGIGICFYVNLTDEEAENATLDFNWLDQSCSNVGLQYDPVTGFYKAVCSVAASEMSSKITATLKINNEVKATDTYSAKECADKLIEGCDETTSKLVKTMLNYGAASQVYFGVDTNNPANASLSAEDNVIADVTPTMINVNTPKYTLPKGVKFAGATLSLRSETSLSIYISSKKPVTDAQCGDYTVETDKSGNYKVLRIRGIKAEDLGKDLTVTFTISDKQYSVTYSPMYYCRSVLMNSSADANLKTVVKAFYWYWQSAKEYANTAYLVS